MSLKNSQDLDCVFGRRKKPKLEETKSSEESQKVVYARLFIMSLHFRSKSDTYMIVRVVKKLYNCQFANYCLG